ncbi:hypothetical protein BSKO_00266 [Bryopsis sp. KO-2023]|nr:hypothetical protein BSKO_00266 [Bryopsis sp. KO-2023]
MAEFSLGVQPGQQDWYSGPPAYSTPQQYAQYTPPQGGYNDSFEDEPPLLEELGIDLAGILKKTKAVITLKTSSQHLEDLDMGGALLFAALLGALHLMMGKLHFGIILGWSVVASAILFFVVNQLAGQGNPDGHSIVLYSCCCLVGYCLIPIVGLSGLALMMPGLQMVRAAAGCICVVWSTFVASGLFVRRSPCLEDQRSLVAYPCFLVYSIFAVLTIY